MKSKMTLVCYTMAAVVLAALCLDSWTPARGQDTSAGRSATVKKGDDRVIDPATIDLYYGIQRTRSNASAGWTRADAGIRHWVKKLQTAKTDAEKDAAKKEMSAALSTYFDADLKNREQDIADIEARVKKLRAQIEKRRAAKEQLVDLQLKVLVNEAEGLGFYSRPGSRSELDPYNSSRPRNSGSLQPPGNTEDLLPTLVPEQSAPKDDRTRG
jgi:hypothetical protein